MSHRPSRAQRRKPTAPRVRRTWAGLGSPHRVLGGIALGALVLLAIGWLVGGFDPTGYEITEVEVAQVKERGVVTKAGEVEADGPAESWKVKFHARWRGSGDPPLETQECRLELKDSSGEILEEDEFGLHVGREADTSAPMTYSREELGGTPATATVSCDP